MAKLINESEGYCMCSECGVLFIPTEDTYTCPHCGTEFDEGEC